MPPEECNPPAALHSARLRNVRSTNTTTELSVRRLVYALGYRYRLHQPSLPGKPDLVFPSRRKLIFVHGCFWHRHEGCPKTQTPRSRSDYWLAKFQRNVERDKTTEAALLSAGWQVLVVWECELRDLSTLTRRLREFLD